MQEEYSDDLGDFQKAWYAVKEIEDAAEKAVEENDPMRRQVALEKFEWFCSFYRDFSDNARPRMYDEEVVSSIEVNFEEVDENSSIATQIMAWQALGEQLEETRKYIGSLFSEAGDQEALRMIGQAYSEAIDDRIYK